MTVFTTRAAAKNASDHCLRAAVTSLTTNGFVITHQDKESVSLTGPGLNSTRQNPILGASRITLRTSGEMLSADAELGGVDAMRRFLYGFPLLLGLSLGLFFGIGGGLLFGKQFGVGFGVPWATGWKWIVVAMAGAMLPVTPWLILSPMMANGIRRRTKDALEALVQNACFAAEAAWK